MTISRPATQIHEGARRKGIEARSKKLDRVCCEILAGELRAGREVRLHVDGSSMLPSVWPRDVLLVHPLIGSKPSVGQVVVFERGGRLIAHRVVGYQCNDTVSMGIVTRGDALCACDEPVRQSEMLGVVNAIVRGGRMLPVQARHPRGILASVLRKYPLACRTALKVRAVMLRFTREAEPQRLT